MAVPFFILNDSRKVTRTRRLIEQLTDFEVREQCGFTASVVKQLVDLYEPLGGHISTAIPVETKVLAFLGQLRSGSFQWMLGRGCGFSQSSASRIIEECVNHTLTFVDSTIDFPISAEEQVRVKQEFFKLGRIPNVLGIVDGTHVALSSEFQTEPAYVNRKQFHSINCQVVAGPDYRFFDVVAKWPGSTHDSYIWANSSVRDRLYTGELGDSFIVGKVGGWC